MVQGSILNFCSIAFAFGGGIATLSWILFALVDPGHKQHSSQRWLILNGLLIAAGVLMALGLPGYYFRQADAAGPLGMVAYAVLFVGLVIPYVAVQSIETAAAPDIPPVMRRWVAVGAPSILLGGILMAAVTIRAGIYPPHAGYLLLAGTFVGTLTVAPPPVPSWFSRNIASTFFTAAICYLGILSLTI